jgi:hypothetical protein
MPNVKKMVTLPEKRDAQRTVRIPDAPGSFPLGKDGNQREFVGAIDDTSQGE